MNNSRAIQLKSCRHPLTKAADKKTAQPQDGISRLCVTAIKCSGTREFLTGDTNNVTLNAVLNNNTGQMLSHPDKMKECVHEAFHQQARPADSRTKTRKYLPEEAKRDYSWEAGAYNNIDPYTL